MQGRWSFAVGALFYQKTLFMPVTNTSAGVYSDSFTVNFPANNIDPGPSQGRLPGDPMLINGPVVNRTLLNQMYPPGTRQKNAGNVNFDSPDRRTPYTRQASIGYERQLTGTMAVSADYIRNDLRDLYMRQNLNPGLRDTTARTSTIRRVDPNFVSSVLEIANIGWANSDSLLVSLSNAEPWLSAWRRLHAVAHARQHGLARQHRDHHDAGPRSVELEQGEARTTQDRPHVLDRRIGRTRTKDWW
jgi:hypothetical protein